MRNPTWLILLALPLSLAACDNANDAEMPMESEDMPIAADGMPMATDDMPMNEDNMPMTGAARTASGEGMVTAIDAEAGTITLDHGPVPAMNWPAMNMAFDAAPEVLDQVAVGDAVTLEFEASDAGNRITSISKK